MEMFLRDYQDNIIEKSRSLMRGGIKRIFITSPTGSGKTVLSASMIQAAAQRGRRSYFLCPRVEILKQTSDAFSRFGIHHGIVAAGFPETDALIQVCSIQTVYRRLNKMPEPYFVVIDEAAHVPAISWAAVLDTWGDAYRFGLSATPCRLNGGGFRQWFDALVEGPTVAELIGGGWLAPYKMYGPSDVDLSGLHTRAGDYLPEELAPRVDKATITGEVIDHYQRLADGTQAVVFCVSVAHSKNVAAAFNSAGITAEHIDGSFTPDERDRIISEYRAGKTRVLTNCNLIVEGFDFANIETCILLRPTQSLAMYMQMIGRALRPAPGKVCKILDHVGNYKRHGLPDTPRKWSLDGIEKRKKGDSVQSVLIRQCSVCFYVHVPAPACPACGFVYEIKRDAPQIINGELAEIDQQVVEQVESFKDQRRKARTLDELIAVGKMRGMKNPYGWARNVLANR
jgi:superfamily II DNA or RNA helicase